jgi:multiple sugar transport system substrate-binding protein
MSGLTPDALIAVPEYMLPFALVYNTDLLQATGDQPPTTWTQFVNTAKKMTDPTKDQWGTVMDPSDSFDPWHILWVLAKQFGDDFITADMTKSTMTSEPVYKAFRFWFDWMANFKIAKTSDATFKGPDLLNKFASGKVGFMVMQGPTTIPTLDKSAVKGKYAFSPMPTIPYGLTSLPSGGVPVQTFVSGQYLTIAKFSKLQDDAILWMKYVTDVTQQMQFLKTYGYMPGTVDAYKQPELQTPVWKAFVNAENNAFATPLTGAWGPIETIVGGVASKIAAEYATNSYKAGDLKTALTATNSSICDRCRCSSFMSCCRMPPTCS